MTLKTSKQLPYSETAHLLQTLRNQQTELELQKEELKIAKIRADEAIEKYTELYDFFPSGYFVLSKQGDIIELNISGSQIFGKERTYLINKRFNLFISDGTKPIFNDFLEKIFKNRTRLSCEVTLELEDVLPIHVELTGMVANKENNCLLTVADITVRRNTEDALKLNQDFLNNIIENSPNSLWISDENGVLLRMNQACRDIFLLDDSDVVGKYNIFNDNQIKDQGFLPLVKTVFENGKTVSFVSYYDTSKIEGVELVKSSQLYLEVHISPIFNGQGKLTHAIIQHFNITEKKRIEKALILSEEKFRSFIKFSSEPIFGFNRDETYYFVNEAFSRPFGKNPDQIIGKTPFDIFPPDEAEKRLSLVREVFQTGEKGEIEVDFATRSGDFQYYLTTADPLRNDRGEVIYVNCVSKDITQLKKTEQAMKISEAQVTALLAAIPDMIFIQDQQGIYLNYHGPINCELYTHPDNFIGKNMFDVIPLEIAQQFEVAFQTARQTGEVQLCEYTLQMPEGPNYFEAKIVAYANSKFLSVIRNVSSHKQAQELIRIKNEDLQRLNAEKDKFFSIIAHDLRSPFSGFLGLTETLSRRLPDMTLKEIQEITFLMRNSSVHLFRLLGNLLEWSRMQRGLTAFVPKTFLVSQKIADYLILGNQLANQKEILIIEKIPEDLIVFADENMFGSIIRNLLSNAIKFTPKGGQITISAEKLSSRLVEFSVDDSGIGMTQLLIDHLFRLDDKKSSRRGTEGEYSSGLGLIICKDFIEKHGGKLKIKSIEGKGSTFSFILPADSKSFNFPSH